MEMLSTIGQLAFFALAAAAAVGFGSRILPYAEMLFSADLPDDNTNEI